MHATCLDRYAQQLTEHLSVLIQYFFQEYDYIRNFQSHLTSCTHLTPTQFTLTEHFETYLKKNTQHHNIPFQTQLTLIHYLSFKNIQLHPLTIDQQNKICVWANSTLKNYLHAQIFSLEQTVLPIFNKQGWIHNVYQQNERQWIPMELNESFDTLILCTLFSLTPYINRKDLTRINAKDLITRLMTQLASKQLTDFFVPTQEKIQHHLTCDQTYHWVELLDAFALCKEGVLMRHCSASYENDLLQGISRLFSLRDKQNKPHLTIELKDHAIYQIKGKAQRPPKIEYLPYIEQFLNHATFLHPIQLHPECIDLLTSGFYWDSACQQIQPITLNTYLHIFNDLTLNHFAHHPLPERLVCHDSLTIEPNYPFLLPTELTTNQLILKRPIQIPLNWHIGFLKLQFHDSLVYAGIHAKVFDITQAPNVSLVYPHFLTTTVFAYINPGQEHQLDPAIIPLYY